MAGGNHEDSYLLTQSGQTGNRNSQLKKIRAAAGKGTQVMRSCIHATFGCNECFPQETADDLFKEYTPEEWVTRPRSR